MTETLNLIVITGPPASGKTTLVTVLQPLLQPHVPIIDGHATKIDSRQMAQYGGLICAQSDDAARLLLAKIVDPAQGDRPAVITFITLEDRHRIDSYPRRADALNELLDEFMAAVYVQIVPDETPNTFKFVGDANGVMAAYTALADYWVTTNR